MTRLDVLPPSPCWLEPDLATDPGRWVVQSADGSVSDTPAPVTRRRLDRALALLAAELRWHRRGEPTMQRAEVYEERPTTAPGHLYLRVLVTDVPEGSVDGEEFWVCTGQDSVIDWQTGLIVVGELDSAPLHLR